ncbi:MAG: alpha/beta fold hydrolase, partial [Terriglobus roseus]|nr:alpha/beta fold hydrolase [Terriglobus roseus]
QWRHVIGPFSDAGYRLIVPDYRGAGNSQAPPSNAGFAGGKGGGYTKVVIADDLHTLVRDHLGIKDKVHVVGHDIGAMVAHAYASWFPNDSASLVWGDCPLPGSTFYEDFKKDQAVWHFTFHNVEDDLPERLVEGHERIYIRHFFDRLSVNPWGIPPSSEDENMYVEAYSRPGAFRAAFDTYRTFEEDARENREQVQEHGKSKVPALGVAGDGSFNNSRAEEQLKEFYESVDVATLKNSGHWIAEEAPEEFFEKVLAWIERKQ